jgi:predicted transcriptional regulator
MKRVLDIMTAKVLTVSPDALVGDASKLAADRGINHLVVLDNEKPVGVVCVCDLDTASPYAPVSQTMSVPAVTVGVQVTLPDAARILRERRVGCLPVTESGKLVGIVSRSDLRREGIADEEFGACLCAACRAHHAHLDPEAGDALFCRECRERAHDGIPDDEEGAGD